VQCDPTVLVQVQAPVGHAVGGTVGGGGGGGSGSTRSCKLRGHADHAAVPTRHWSRGGGGRSHPLTAMMRSPSHTRECAAGEPGTTSITWRGEGKYVKNCGKYTDENHSNGKVCPSLLHRLPCSAAPSAPRRGRPGRVQRAVQRAPIVWVLPIRVGSQEGGHATQTRAAPSGPWLSSPKTSPTPTSSSGGERGCSYGPFL
jgi:hypothetical protein